MGPFESFDDIPRLIDRGSYSVHVGFNYLEKFLGELARQPGGLDLNPDFQRGHVWTEAQQVAFVEYALRGGLESSSGVLLFNCADWDDGSTAPTQIVDGLQRLTAVRTFLGDGIPAFGRLRSEYSGNMPSTGGLRFEVHVNKLRTRAEVLRWYLEINSGGVVHSAEELERVQGLLSAESGDAPRLASNPA